MALRPTFRRVFAQKSAKSICPISSPRQSAAVLEQIGDKMSSKPFRSPDSVKAVLGRSTPTLTRVSEQATRQTFWKQCSRQHLPSELTPRLSGVVERDDTMVIFTESAAWSARLRYVMQGTAAPDQTGTAHNQQVSVRVMPKA